MSIKLALLKSGEDIIADIQEVIHNETGDSFYIFKNSYAVKLITSQTLVESFDSNDSKQVSVSFSPWIPLSKDKIIEVPKDWVVTIVEPIKMVKDSYIERMNKNGNKSDRTDGSIGNGGSNNTNNIIN